VVVAEIPPVERLPRLRATDGVPEAVNGARALCVLLLED
jgi:hypothetical protein